MRYPPSGRVPEQGLDWVLVAKEACGSRTPDLFYSPKFLGYMGIYRRKKYVRGATRAPRGAHEGGGRAQGGGRAPLPRDLLEDPPTCAPSLMGFFPSKNWHVNWTPFGIPFL